MFLLAIQDSTCTTRNGPSLWDKFQVPSWENFRPLRSFRARGACGCFAGFDAILGRVLRADVSLVARVDNCASIHETPPTISFFAQTTRFSLSFRPSSPCFPVRFFFYFLLIEFPLFSFHPVHSRSFVRSLTRSVSGEF